MLQAMIIYIFNFISKQLHVFSLVILRQLIIFTIWLIHTVQKKRYLEHIKWNEAIVSFSKEFSSFSEHLWNHLHLLVLVDNHLIW